MIFLKIEKEDFKMKMKFNEKMEAYLKAYEDIDSYIWEIFYDFTKLKQIKFSNPEYWRIEKDNGHISFTGTDSTKEYHSKTLFIPLGWFICFSLAKRTDPKGNNLE
jgi:hypothetical protein